MKHNKLKMLFSLLLLCALLIGNSSSVFAAGVTARPSSAGKLHLAGTSLAGENGEPVQLRGVSTHGLTYYPEYVNDALFAQLSSEWNCDLVRLAMYVSEYNESAAKKRQSLEVLEKGIEYCIQNDMYVLVDWHLMEASDPSVNLPEALDFFAYISEKYADCPNVLYEICNEPDWNASWETVKSYAEQVIPVIKANNPDAVISVGTPRYDTDLRSPAANPITGYSNILYTFHFYANSHFEQMQELLENAINAGLPVFVTECGIVDLDGNGKTNYENAEVWFSLLDRCNISYTVWNLSNKSEASAMFKNTVRSVSRITDRDLTPCGQYVKALLQGEDLHSIPSGINETVSFRELWLGDRFFAYGILAGGTVLLLALLCLWDVLSRNKGNRSYDSLLKKTGDTPKTINKKGRQLRLGKLALLLSVFTTVIYLTWRIFFSLPKVYGNLPSLFSVLLLLIEIVGFAESCIHYNGMIRLRDYPLPEIAPEEYPDVDIFVATYNESAELLRKTLIGCRSMRYPDKSKVHIYLCDDNRRTQMQELAEELGVHYFKRADNEGAKAGNLNAAMARTSSPYVVTFDADMIPQEDFLLKTIPYFVDAEKRNEALPESEKMPLGLLQTPQSFYNPDVFQHNLYAEKRIPNEQDFFYRTIEVSKTSTNSVIYGGSNTVLSRKAIEAIGGFYTGSITEDFATGLLIESNGFISLALPEPLASGLSPASFTEHIQQRTRWGRGVILTAKKIRFLKNRNLSAAQKLSYLSSVIYWYSSVKNWFYVLAPLVFAVLGLPVLICELPDILLFWLPMFVFQSLTLRLISGGSLSVRRSGIQETCMMPFLFFPVLKESFGISLSTFKVTDKKASAGKSRKSWRLVLPFLLLVFLSAVGIVRMIVLLCMTKNFSLLSVLYWLFRNLYFLLMCLFLVDGRDGNGENVIVTDAEPVEVIWQGQEYPGITTTLTEHSVAVFADDMTHVRLGQSIAVSLNGLSLSGTVVAVRERQNKNIPPVLTMEILDFGGQEDEYIHLLYNRVPTLPQNLNKDIGLLRDFWLTLVHHLAEQV